MAKIKKLFENSGEKIKKLALILFIVEMIALCLGALVMLILGCMNPSAFIMAYGIAVGILAIGFITTYVSSLFLYGFGELVANSKKDN